MTIISPINLHACPRQKHASETSILSFDETSTQVQIEFNGSAQRECLLMRFIPDTSN